MDMQKTLWRVLNKQNNGLFKECWTVIFTSGIPFFAEKYIRKRLWGASGKVKGAFDESESENC